MVLFAYSPHNPRRFAEKSPYPETQYITNSKMNKTIQTASSQIRKPYLSIYRQTKATKILDDGKLHKYRPNRLSVRWLDLHRSLRKAGQKTRYRSTVQKRIWQAPARSRQRPLNKIPSKEFPSSRSKCPKKRTSVRFYFEA